LSGEKVFPANRRDLSPPKEKTVHQTALLFKRNTGLYDATAAGAGFLALAAFFFRLR